MPSQINLITMTYHGRRPLGPESRPRLGLPCPGVDEAETAARAALSMMEAGYTPHRVVQHRPINISLGAYEWGEDLCARLSDQQEEGLEEGDNPDITIDWGDAQDVYRNHGIAYAKLFHEHYQDSVDEYGAITINARLLARLPAFIDKDRRYDRAAEINQMIYHNVGLCLEELHATPPKVFAALAATMSEAGLSQSQQRTIMLNLAPENPGGPELPGRRPAHRQPPGREGDQGRGQGPEGRRRLPGRGDRRPAGPENAAGTATQAGPQAAAPGPLAGRQEGPAGPQGSCRTGLPGGPGGRG